MTPTEDPSLVSSRGEGGEELGSSRLQNDARDAKLLTEGTANTHDFRTGRNGWGHTLHAGTWRELPPRTVTTGWLWWKREVPVAAQASVMVHCSRWPEVGDRLLMSGKSGSDWNVKIVGVEPCWNPRDMFTLTLEFDQEPLSSEEQPSACERSEQGNRTTVAPLLNTSEADEKR